MAIRDKMTQAAQPHLAPGEQLQAVIGAQTTSQYLFLLGVIPFILLNKYRLIAVTDQRILVLDAGKWSMVGAKGVAYDLPRATVLGPGSGIWHTIVAHGETLRVHRRFFKDLAEADRLGAGPAAPAAPPA